MRIVAGRWRGRRIDCAEGRARSSHRRPRARGVDEHRQPVAARRARARPLRRIRGARTRSALARRRRRGLRRDRRRRASRRSATTSTRLGAGDCGGHPPRRCAAFRREARTPAPTTSRSPTRRTTSRWRRGSPSGGSTRRSRRFSASSTGRRETLPGEPDRAPLRRHGDQLLRARAVTSDPRPIGL